MSSRKGVTLRVEWLPTNPIAKAGWQSASADWVGHQKIYCSSFIIYPIAAPGRDIANNNLDNPLRVKVQAEDYFIQIFINDILLVETNASLKEAPLEFRICSDKDFELFDIATISSQPKIFEVMQFTKDYNELYEGVILPVTN